MRAPARVHPLKDFELILLAEPYGFLPTPQ
jgi:hypothetical protein